MTEMKIPMHLPQSIAGRIKFINVSVLVLIVTLFASFLISSHSYHDMQVQGQLKSALADMKDDLNHVQQTLWNEALLLQHHEAILDYFLSVNMETVNLKKSLPESLQNHLNMDVLLMYGLDGAYLGGFGESLLQKFTHDRDQNDKAFWYSDGAGLYAMVQSPVYYGKDILGFMVLAKMVRIDDFQDVAKGMFAMQLKLDKQPLLQANITQYEIESKASMDSGTVVLSPSLRQPLTLEVYMPRDKHQQNYIELFLWLAMLLGVMLWVWLFHYYVKGGIGRLQDLKQRVLKLQLGEILPVPDQQRDEVDVLGAEFAALTQRLALQTDALDAKRKMLQTILDAAPVAIWMTDSDANIVFMNRNLSLFLSANKGLSFDADLMRSLLPQMFHELSLETLKDDIALHEMVKLQHASQEFCFDVVCAPLHDGQEQVDGMVAFAIDRSMREQAKKAMKEMQTRVEHVQRLESLGVLAGGIAHDFNNLLAVIVGASSLAKRDINNVDNINRQLQRISQASDRAAELCKQMLDYAGEGQYELQALDLSVLLSNITELLTVTHGEQVNLDVKMSDDLPMVEADVGQIQQVVMNLITNACDACADEGGKVILETGLLHVHKQDLLQYMASEESESGDYVFIKVSDNGCGMDADTKAKVFDPFFSTKFAGRGLGMSAVLGIVRSHYGVLSLQSELGKGTVCMVALPVNHTLK